MKKVQFWGPVLSVCLLAACAHHAGSNDVINHAGAGIGSTVSTAGAPGSPPATCDVIGIVTTAISAQPDYQAPGIVTNLLFTQVGLGPVPMPTTQIIATYTGTNSSGAETLLSSVIVDQNACSVTAIGTAQLIAKSSPVGTCDTDQVSTAADPARGNPSPVAGLTVTETVITGYVSPTDFKTPVLSDYSTLFKITAAELYRVFTNAQSQQDVVLFVLDQTACGVKMESGYSVLLPQGQVVITSPPPPPPVVTPPPAQSQAAKSFHSKFVQNKVVQQNQNVQNKTPQILKK